MTVFGSADLCTADQATKRSIRNTRIAAETAERARAVLTASEAVDYSDPQAVELSHGRLQGVIDNLLDYL